MLLVAFFVADLVKQVYREYAIPLINRLEKHILSTENLLREQSALSGSSNNVVRVDLVSSIG